VSLETHIDFKFLQMHVFDIIIDNENGEGYKLEKKELLIRLQTSVCRSVFISA